MKSAFMWLFVIIMSLTLLIFAASTASEKAAERDYARAAVIRASSEARLDATAAFLPYVALAVAFIFGCIMIAVGLVILVKLDDAEPLRFVETRTVIVLPTGQSRREFWRQVSEVKLLERK